MLVTAICTLSVAMDFGTNDIFWRNIGELSFVEPTVVLWRRHTDEQDKPCDTTMTPAADLLALGLFRRQGT